MINAGADNHPFHPHGNHTRQIAQDGRLLLSPAAPRATTEHFGETIGAGADARLPAALGRRQDTLEPEHEPAPGGAAELPEPDVQGRNTWYSGSPVPGYKGTLPTGTNPQNICGEWYFPFHSHALNEFSNFDEGFGGMGTLLRVDPPGGCFTLRRRPPRWSAACSRAARSACRARRARRRQLLPGQPETTTTHDRRRPADGRCAHGRVASNRASRPRPLLRPDRQRGHAGHRRLRERTTWTVDSRGQLGTAAAAHAPERHADRSGHRLVRELLRRRGRRAEPEGDLQGQELRQPTGAACAALTTNLAAADRQDLRLDDRGRTAARPRPRAGWVTLPAPQASRGRSGSTEVSTTWTVPGPSAALSSAPARTTGRCSCSSTPALDGDGPTPFSTWGNLMKLVYDAP